MYRVHPIERSMFNTNFSNERNQKVTKTRTNDANELSFASVMNKVLDQFEIDDLGNPNRDLMEGCTK